MRIVALAYCVCNVYAGRMNQINSFTDVIRLWPKPKALAALIDERPGTVRQWVIRDTIPSDKFPAVVNAAAEWHFPQVTMDLLKQLHQARHGDKPQPKPSADVVEFS